MSEKISIYKQVEIVIPAIKEINRVASCEGSVINGAYAEDIIFGNKPSVHVKQDHLEFLATMLGETIEIREDMEIADRYRYFEHDGVIFFRLPNDEENNKDAEEGGAEDDR